MRREARRARTRAHRLAANWPAPRPAGPTARAGLRPRRPAAGLWLRRHAEEAQSSSEHAWDGVYGVAAMREGSDPRAGTRGPGGYGFAEMRKGRDSRAGTRGTGVYGFAAMREKHDRRAGTREMGAHGFAAVRERHDPRAGTRGTGVMVSRPCGRGTILERARMQWHVRCEHVRGGRFAPCDFRLRASQRAESACVDVLASEPLLRACPLERSGRAGGTLKYGASSS